jgi:catechol 2,3-dioxygenase-like lactoylglutathione lyase family enzyme
MTLTLNHTIVRCRDKNVSATYLTEVLGLEGPRTWGPFLVVELGNGVSLDFQDHHESEGEITSQHFAFLVTEDEFDEIFVRIKTCQQTYWAGPGLRDAGNINHYDGGRGMYFEDPDGHLLEIITRPYGTTR